jgi:hypothetical protein
MIIDIGLCILGDACGVDLIQVMNEQNSSHDIDQYHLVLTPSEFHIEIF